MYARRQNSRQLRGAIALIMTLALVPVVSRGSPAPGYEYHLQGAVFYVSNGTNNELDLTQTFHAGQVFTLSWKLDPAGMAATDDHTAECANCATDLRFSVGSYSGSQSGGTSMVQVMDNAPEDGDVCGGQDPSIDRLLVSTTGIDAPAVAGASPMEVAFALTDCDAGAWSSLAIPKALAPMNAFEARIMILFFSDGVRAGWAAATITDGVVPVAQASWGRLKMRYR